ncbi:MAG: zinc metallopeptidase [Lachnospiraceae bacterium]|nr:zinc metallopeptidase [Lachnospiraceae bacterium]
MMIFLFLALLLLSRLMFIIVMVNFDDEDCFNPANNTITLSQVHNQNSISSVAIAMHEVGHALQFNEGWWLYKFRCYIVSLKNVFIYVSAVGIGLWLVVDRYKIIAIISIVALLVCIIVEDYIKDTGNHVMYRVTPVFEENNLLATGVLMEAKSVEDSGKGIMFCVFIYNVQDGIVIDYATGDSYAKEIVTTTQTPTTTDNATSEQETTTNNENKGKYAVNMRNGKIHIVGQCSATGTGDQAMKNAQYFDTYEEAEAYSAQIAPDQNKRKCGNCW